MIIQSFRSIITKIKVVVFGRLSAHSVISVATSFLLCYCDVILKHFLLRYFLCWTYLVACVLVCELSN